MCGIAGIVGHGWDRSQLEAMIAIQHHRGPDDNGVYVDPANHVGLGHNRLSILDLSNAGHQPMCNADRSRWIVFNGEIYNYRELRAKLADYPYKSLTDTEVILAAFERWGEACVEHFIGMFAFALWDDSSQSLFCARDRLGIKPFHYAWHNGCFLFASEIKAILAAGYPASANLISWATYLGHGIYDHSSETFFAGVQVLEPGHIAAVRNGTISVRRYWDLPKISGDIVELSDDVAGEQMLELLDHSVRLRLRSDVPVGVNLSGGLDSSSLMSVVDPILGEDAEVKAFTACFGDPRYDEQDFAAEVPCRSVWSRQTQRLDCDKVWDIATEALWHQEAPYGGIATLAYHHLHRLARENDVTVLLEGQGVDEMLGGYAYFRPHYFLDLLENGRMQDLRHELRACARNGAWESDMMRQVQSGAAPNVYQDGTNYLGTDCVVPEFHRLAGRAPVFAAPFSDRLRNALYRDLRYTKLPRVLRMNDRLSMAFSRELREPYLDHRLVEFLFRLPGDQKIRSGQGKYLLRHAMATMLPERVRRTSKRAVVTPQREWLRDPLRPQVEEIIHSRSFAQREIFNIKQVHSRYAEFCSGAGDNAFFVWQWVNTEMWWRMFIDQRIAA